MKIPKNKIAAITIAIFFILSMTASMILIPNANAVTLAPGKISIATFSFIAVNPNPAGVGQTVNVGFWLAQPPPTAYIQYGDRWTNMTVKVTKPDGTTETLGPFTSDDTGGTHTSFTPATVGNYTFQMFFGGEVLPGNNLPPPGYYTNATLTEAYIGDYYEPSVSPVVTLTVQSTAVPGVPEISLPTSYWTRPIESVNDLWYNLSGNWLGFGQLFSGATGMYNNTGDYNPYTTAPTTAHILWTKPMAFGGLIGGEFSTSGGESGGSYYSTRQYEPIFSPIIINGILYYTEYPESIANPAGWAAVNLQTGQTIWTTDTPTTLPSPIGSGSTLTPNNPTEGPPTVLRCGQILDYTSPNQYGALAYLWSTGTPASVAAATNIATIVMHDPYTGANTVSTTWNMFDAMTGEYILSIVNGTAMQLTEDANGDLIGYYVNATSQTLNCWNSTQCIINYDLQTKYNINVWEWRPPQGAIIPFKDGIMWSKPIATSINGVRLPETLSFGTIGSGAVGPINSGVCLLYIQLFSGENFFNTGYEIEAGYSATTGQQLWVVNRTETPFTRVDLMPVSNGIYVEINQDTAACIGYSVTTGKVVWGPITLPNADPYNSIGSYYGIPANGVLYVSGFGGNIYAIKIATGAIIWQTTTNAISGNAGSNTPYGVWPLWSFGNQGAIADGILFLAEGHEYSPPLFRGANYIAINITNGQPVWNILSFASDGGTAISDGVLATQNAYDNQIYAYGKGPSATTVTAPDIGVTTSTPVTITGTVLDTSAGSQQEAVAANFPHGLPCVSDASMTQFMEAVYEQQPMPTNVTGVPVQIAVLDSNGNHYPIGTVTTDESGSFSITWTPTIPGNFTVYATFAGTQSYYGSYAEAHFYASTPAPTAAPTAAPPTGLASTGTVMLGVAAIIIVIVICVAVAILMLRRRP
jgi:hypothetical protein